MEYGQNGDKPKRRKSKRQHQNGDNPKRRQARGNITETATKTCGHNGDQGWIKTLGPMQKGHGKFVGRVWSW